MALTNKAGLRKHDLPFHGIGFLFGSVKTFLGTYRAIPAGPTPLAQALSERLPPGLIWTDFDPKRAILGPNQVKIGSKAGLGGGVQRRSGPEG